MWINVRDLGVDPGLNRAMKSWLIPGLAGLIAGAGLVYALESTKASAEAARNRTHIAELEQSLAKAQQETKTVTTRLDSLRQQATPAIAEPAPTQTGPDQAATDETKALERQAQRQAFMERMTQRSLDRWTGKLKLTPDQITRLKNLAQARMANPAMDARAWGAFEAELLQVLTPEQKAAYDHIQTREAQARQELRVNVELSRVQGMFDLSDAQKDQIFQKFAALETATPATASASPSAPMDATAAAKARDERNQKRVDALKGILTPEQLKEYADSLAGNNGGGNSGFRGR